MGRDIAGEREMRRTHGRRVSGFEALVVEGEQRRLLLLYSQGYICCGSLTDMRASGVNMNLSGISIATLESSRSSISTIDLAIERTAAVRGDLGAIQNRLGFTIRSLENAVENVQASESTIRDADVAEEVSAFTRAQILVQSSTALLAQANAIPQNALSLLQ